MRKQLFYWGFVLFCVSSILLTGCSKNPEDFGEEVEEEIVLGDDELAGDLTEFTFESGKTYTVVQDIFVPRGKDVTIPAGVRVEFAMGTGNQRWTLDVYGSLYVEGSEDNRVIFTATDDALASAHNMGTGGLWGGIIGTDQAGDIVIEYADIMHGGGPAKEGDAITTPRSGGTGRLDVGEPSYMLYFCRPAGGERASDEGVFVLKNSYIAYTMDDAIRTNGGKTLMVYNTFEVIGRTGGEAVNIKAGGYGDFAFNLFYNLATNGLKTADSQAGERGILENNFYNNTILNSGYRRADVGRGGSLNYENGAYGKCYNNLMVNTRYGLRLPYDDRPDMTRFEYGYNYYYAVSEELVNNFYPTNKTDPSRGVIGSEPPVADPENPDLDTKFYAIPESDVIGAAGENDPLFANYTPSDFSVTFTTNSEGVVSGNSLINNYTPMATDADFHLKAGSPAASGAKTDFSPVFNEYKTLKGKVFTAPQPASYFGAFPVVGTAN